MNDFDWYENDNGNYVMTDQYGQRAATVFEKDGRWRVIVVSDDGSSKLLLPKLETPLDGRRTAEREVKQPGSVPAYKERIGWHCAKESYNGAPKYFRRTPDKTYTVRRASSGKWFSNVTTPPDRWFATHLDAMAYVDAVTMK